VNVHQEELLFAGQGNGRTIRKQISAKLTRAVQEQLGILKGQCVAALSTVEVQELAGRQEVEVKS
jgi:hypothetical protein